MQVVAQVLHIHLTLVICLMGCMICQAVCPQDKALMGWFKDCGEFCEEETARIVAGTKMDELSAETRMKLSAADLLDENYALIGRNLVHLIHTQREHPEVCGAPMMRLFN